MADSIEKIAITYGYQTINTWFELQADGSSLGMSSLTTYDGDNKLIAHEITPTGTRISYG